MEQQSVGQSIKSYLQRQEESGIEVGDEVEVVRTASSHEDGWSNSWEPEMDECVGKTGIVDKISGESGIYVLGWGFPYFVLEKIDNSKTAHWTIE